MHNKLRVYRRNSVQEYLVWRIVEQKLDWFGLQAGEYISLLPDESGFIHSRIFPGLDLPVAALLAGDLATVLPQVQKTIAIPTHKVFVD